ncbi:UUP1 family membrane protein [Algiphilus aromaticivorans]|uniref:UUP1 family membrane protein n=1 Tax=Algiphilus aromaticivorans TaxID=382454 RepID=UPI0005C1322B|nr:UUP1 family membrane protein [Algiphilus aromaticivorans]
MRLHLWLLALALTAVGVGTVWYKHSVLGFPLEAEATTDAWIVEARLGFEPIGGAVKAQLSLPESPPGYRILEENFISRGYGVAVERIDQQRTAVWTQRRPSGRQALFYRATLVPDNSERETDAPVPLPPPVPDYEEPYLQAVNSVLDEVRSRSADVATFASRLVQMLASPESNDNIRLMLEGKRSDVDKVSTAIHMLAGARIPARMVRGVRLEDGARDLQPSAWLEVHNGEEWVPIDPANGNTGYPPNFVKWWKSAADPAQVTRARNVNVRFAAKRSQLDALQAIRERASDSVPMLVEFSLLNLPVQTQNLYRILLLVPLGVLLIVFLRNVIGVKTFGTFMPVLIAISFRETQLIGGIVLFSLVTALGLSVRFYLERLKLLMVPRLAAVVIVVILLIALLSVISYQLRLPAGLSVSLFPIVILAMTIERMSVVWEEHGAGESVRQGLGSLLVAVAGYLLMFHTNMEHLMLVFPELLLVVLALVLLLGRYTGYRLTELLRFRNVEAP